LSEGVDGDRRQEPGERALRWEKGGWEAGFRRWWEMGDAKRWEPTIIGWELGLQGMGSGTFNPPPCQTKAIQEFNQTIIVCTLLSLKEKG